MRETRANPQDWRAAIERSGYYPALVTDAVADSLGEEPAVASLVHHETVFDPAMEVHRHVTVLLLTPTRLIVSHTDEHPPTEEEPKSHASTTTETVRLSKVTSVMLVRVVPDPESYRPGTPPSEVVLTLGYGAVANVDLEPASCGDESCEADHGYTGAIRSDDFSVRFSAAADGPDAVRDAIAFADALSGAIG
ncbi:DUF5998 family protein [Allonocardiopsis opalescens]|uniref:Phosphodiesterase n=1 Tax=Allonocardiopsis opalescens TaxID=1144618 RepID=A0A2T0Q0L4_9ACTN|nr:DUF5998 family protein [Allonocardiopsis opalescens]PRX97328.1 hypothetical protein CLV72_106365 [Allonocardiopsis opalescens]